MAIKQSSKPKSGLAIASLILGLVSFIPLIGVLLGAIAITLGIIASLKISNNHTLGGKNLAIAGTILGVLGICFTFLIYGSLFYFGFVAKDGPFANARIMASQQILTQNAGYLELYKKKHDKYPRSLEELGKDGYTAFPTDHYLKPLFYKVSEDGEAYELRSLGPDGTYNTADDIFPQK